MEQFLLFFPVPSLPLDTSLHRFFFHMFHDTHIFSIKFSVRFRIYFFTVFFHFLSHLQNNFHPFPIFTEMHFKLNILSKSFNLGSIAAFVLECPLPHSTHHFPFLFISIFITSYFLQVFFIVLPSIFGILISTANIISEFCCLFCHPKRA